MTLREIGCQYIQIALTGKWIFTVFVYVWVYKWMVFRLTNAAQTGDNRWLRQMQCNPPFILYIDKPHTGSYPVRAFTHAEDRAMLQCCQDNLNASTFCFWVFISLGFFDPFITSIRNDRDGISRNFMDKLFIFCFAYQHVAFQENADKEYF